MTDLFENIDLTNSLKSVNNIEETEIDKIWNNINKTEDEMSSWIDTATIKPDRSKNEK